MDGRWASQKPVQEFLAGPIWFSFVEGLSLVGENSVDREPVAASLPRRARLRSDIRKSTGAISGLLAGVLELRQQFENFFCAAWQHEFFSTNFRLS
jgi:hypothetical protein